MSISHYGALFRGTATSSGTAKTFTLTGGAGVGDLVLVAVCVGAVNNPTSCTVTDSQGNTWVLDSFAANGTTLAVAVARSTLTTALAAGDTITVTLDVSSPRWAVNVDAFRGVDSSGPDVTDTNTGSSTTPSGGPTAATGAAGELVFAAFGLTDKAYTVAGGDTLLASTVTAAGSSERQIVSQWRTSGDPAAQTSTGSLSTSGLWAGAVCCYTAAETIPVSPLEVTPAYMLRGRWPQAAAGFEGTTPPPPPPPPPGGTMSFGFTAGTPITDPLTLEAAVGCRFAVRRAYNGSIPASFAASSSAEDRGYRASYVSMKWGAGQMGTAAGRQAGADALRTFGMSWPANHHGWVTLWHEPEDQIEAGDFTLANWQDFQARCVVAWREAVGARVPIGANLQSYSCRTTSGRDIEAYMDAAAAADLDFVAWNGYSKISNSSPSAEDVFVTSPGPLNQPKSPTDLATEYSMPFAIGESGCDLASARVAFTEDVAGIVQDADGLFCIYWNSDRTGLDYPWSAGQYPDVYAVAMAYGGTDLP